MLSSNFIILMPASHSVPAVLSVLSQTPIIIFAAGTKYSVVSRVLPVVASFSASVSATTWSPLGCLLVVVLVDGSLLIACP